MLPCRPDVLSATQASERVRVGLANANPNSDTDIDPDPDPDPNPGRSGCLLAASPIACVGCQLVVMHQVGLHAFIASLHKQDYTGSSMD